MANEKAPRIYAPVSVKAKEGQFGPFFSIGGKAEKLIEFIKANTKENGFIDLTMSERREPSQYGDTHSLFVDDWKAPVNAPTKPF